MQKPANFGHQYLHDAIEIQYLHAETKEYHDWQHFEGENREEGHSSDFLIFNQIAKDKFGAFIGEVEKPGHLVAEALEYLFADGPAQYHQAEHELQRHSPQHLIPHDMSPVLREDVAEEQKT